MINRIMLYFNAVTEKSSSMFDEFRVKHEKCFQKGEGWDLYFGLVLY